MCCLVMDSRYRQVNHSHTPPHHTPLPETTVTIISISRPPALAKSRERLQFGPRGHVFTTHRGMHSVCAHLHYHYEALKYRTQSQDYDSE